MVGVHWLFKKVNKMTTLLTKIQKDLIRKNLDAVIISKSDPFLCGYYEPYKNRLKDVTGFSGSDGVAVICQTGGVLFVDSRYTEQAKIQTSLSVLEVPRDTRLSLWLKENMRDKKVLFDEKVHSNDWLLQMDVLLKGTNISLITDEDGLFDSWFGQVDFKQDIFDYSLEYAGVSSQDKISKVVAYLNQKKLDGVLILSPENTSWLLNQRDAQKSEYPVVYQRLLVLKNGQVLPFVGESKNLNGLKIAVDLKKATVSQIKNLKQQGVCLVHETEIVDDLKAVKNDVEINNIIQL